MRLHHLLLLPALLALHQVAAEPVTTQQYLDQANLYLGQGEFNKALQSYDAAIGKEHKLQRKMGTFLTPSLLFVRRLTHFFLIHRILDRDPSNYLSYFKRAATYLTMGRNNQALADFTTILRLKPDFGQALLQRGKIYTKAGEFSKAKEDLLAFYETHKSDTQAQEIPALLESIEAASHAFKLAQDAVAQGQTEECVHILGSAILVSPLYVPFRMQRAECHLARGEVEEAVNDFA